MYVPVRGRRRVFAKLMPSLYVALTIDHRGPAGDDGEVISTDEEGQLIEQVIERLARKHPHIPRRDVSAVVLSAHNHFRGRKIRDFVPLLVERHAHEQLTSMTEPAF